MINLGDEVRDMVTSFKGVAVARHSYLQGCDRIAIQPPVDKEGKLPEIQVFDEPQLVVIKAAKIKRQAPTKDPGGPEKYSDRGRQVSLKKGI